MPSADGGGRPVQVRVFNLASVDEFMEADFFALDGDPGGYAGQGADG